MKRNIEKPFFVYLAHSMPHVKLEASADLKGKSAGGLYGDVVEETDWNVGRIFQTLEAEGLDENTYVIFTSDNGPGYFGRSKAHINKSGTIGKNVDWLRVYGDTAFYEIVCQ